MNVKEIRIDSYDYPLPESRIALYPLADRESCKLFAADDCGNISHGYFRDLPGLLDKDTLLACNDTRVINARIEMRKPTGSRIEIFLLEPEAPADYVQVFQSKGHCRWRCLVGNRKRWKEGSLEKKIIVDGLPVMLAAEIAGECPGNSYSISFSWNGNVNWASIVDAAGRIPIPPYLNRASEESDNDDYQTVYAKIKGSVAAPTAGLHFTDHLIQEIKDKGITFLPVTLHVGAGTFQPVKSETIGDHPMHTETFTVTADTIGELLCCKTEGKTLTAVGTTTVRTLESLPRLGYKLGCGDESLYVSQWEAYSEKDYDTAEALQSLGQYMQAHGLSSITAATSIMIAPGFRWRMVDAMVTNFHQPQSTLLLLVSSFLGEKDGVPLWRGYYDKALAGDYRFLSYGDACFFRRTRKHR